MSNNGNNNNNQRDTHTKELNEEPISVDKSAKIEKLARYFGAEFN